MTLYVSCKSVKFKFAEKCLYEYKRNIACLGVLKEDLRVAEADTDVRAQNYQYTFSTGGEVSDPVSARLMKIEMLKERIKYLERYTGPITTLMNDLNTSDALNGSRNQDLMQVLRLMYFGGNTPDVIMNELKIARTSFFRLRRELVYVVICYLGL